VLAFGGERTVRLRYDAAEQTVQAALRALVTVQSASVSKAGGTWTITVIAKTGVTAAVLTADGTRLVAGPHRDGGRHGAAAEPVPDRRHHARVPRQQRQPDHRSSGVVRVTYDYAVLGYDGVAVEDLDVRVDDGDWTVGPDGGRRNDVPAVLVFQPGGGTTAVEGGPPAPTTSCWRTRRPPR
jgi:hypothetical protein